MSVAPAEAGAPPAHPRPPGEEGAAFVKTFPCTGCGAKLAFAPGTRTLRCEFCATENAIDEDDRRVEELDFEEYLRTLEGRAESVEEQQVRCDKCGAAQNLEGNLFASHCSFCGAAIVAKGYANRHVKPESLVPFQVDRPRAQEHFRRWVRGRWLAPTDLKRYAQSDAGLSGVYLPFWTYDCRTASDYQGERGDDYYTTETYTTRNASGQSVTQTRQVRHTRWTPVAGRVEAFHDDVLVMASHSLPATVSEATERWELSALVPFKPEFVSGFKAEAYQVGLADGFPIAKAEIDARVRSLVGKDIGGDHQRIHSVASRYSDVKFKHVLLPVWISAYRYRDKAYRFVINGQTGEVSGESPTSWWKVAFLVLAILVGLLILMVAGAE